MNSTEFNELPNSHPLSKFLAGSLHRLSTSPPIHNLNEACMSPFGQVLIGKKCVAVLVKEDDSPKYYCGSALMGFPTLDCQTYVVLVLKGSSRL